MNLDYSFKEGINLRNYLLHYAEQYLKHWYGIDDGSYVIDNEMIIFDPLPNEEGKQYQVKIFYGTRKEGVKKGYHNPNYKKSKEYIMGLENIDDILDFLVKCKEIKMTNGKKYKLVEVID